MMFQTFLIKTNDSDSMLVSLVGALLFIVSICLWAFKVGDAISLSCTLLGIVLVIIGIVGGNGRSLYEVDQQRIIKIEMDRIVVGTEAFEFNKIDSLEFHYHSFLNQSSLGYFTETAGAIEHGINNVVNFKLGDRKVSERFFISSIQHADKFFSTLKVLKENGIQYNLSFRKYR
ncbi:hypothetical protein OI18_17415 [Flavihumibacter solisilvae]|uniref:Uncharacterized protein n=2 Tax=Flavihumibacter solisilvae TaxID=1349421 RepID=A0A0C1LDK1_9BACT|nr:hypothetical protein OI18_17415 [Flavihumibacter solisilvae]